MREYFSELYGNDGVKSRLGNAIVNESLPHAHLVIGAEGSGKKILARELASALNCERKSDLSSPLPCHRCNTCRRIREEKFTDITHLSRSDGKATIGVEEVRAFREDMYLSPTESKYKIYVIEEAEKLTVNAQNALLTVLEEPPKNVFIILLCASGDKILTTIKSRAQSISMQRFEGDELKSYLLMKSDKARLLSKTDGSILDGIVVSSDGIIGKALSFLSNNEARENNEQRLLTERIIKSLRTSAPYSELYSAISELPNSRIDLSAAIESLISAIRDITLIKFDENLQLLFFTSRADAASIAKDMNTKRLIRICDILKDALEDNSKNVSTAAIITDLGAKIKLI